VQVFRGISPVDEEKIYGGKSQVRKTERVTKDESGDSKDCDDELTAMCDRR